MYGRKSVPYLKKYGVQFIIVFFSAIAGTAFAVSGPRLLGNATTEIFRGIMAKLDGTGGMDFEAVGRILALLLVLYLSGAFFTFLAGWLMAGISGRLTYDLRNAVSKKLYALPMSYYETKTTGEILARATTDIDTFGQTISQSVSQLITAAVMLIGIVVMMLQISAVVTGIAVLVLPASWGILRLMTKKARIYCKKQQEYLGSAYTHVEEAYSGYAVVKAFGKEEEFSRQFQEKNKILCEASWRADFYSGAIALLTQLAGNIGYVVTVLFGGWFAFSGALQVGDIQALIHYIRNISQPVQQISQAFGMLQSAAAAWERILEFLGEPEEADTSCIESPRAGTIREYGPKENNFSEESAAPEKGSVCFSHVSFGYSEQHMVLRDFSAEIKPGQRAAIVGRTGVGKTTLMKLLLRFYDAAEGTVYVDGTDVREYSRETLRKKFAVVLQDTWLFHGTVMDNIRYGRPEASKEEVKAAAVMASADPFIQALPEGYDTVIDAENGSLSKGQKQLLTIARAILADPEILVLDEATSSVDTRTEQQIRLAMDSLMRGRTCFIIAHRLSTIRGADIVLRMEEADADGEKNIG